MGIEKSVLGSVRLDSDVWEAVRSMPESLNQYLRRELMGEARARPEAKRLAGGFGVEIRPDPRPEPDGIEGTITVDTEGKSATVNVVSKKMPTWKRGPRQKGDKGR